jgi:hypothetical protein
MNHPHINTWQTVRYEQQFSGKVVSKILRFPEIQQAARGIQEEFLNDQPNPNIVYEFSRQILDRFIIAR